MKFLALLLATYFIFIVPSFAQAPDTMWTKTFGGGDSDWGHSVQQTSDGGYIITGGTESFGAGERDIWLIKTNENGDTLWTKTFGVVNWELEWGYSVQQTSDGGYIITGGTGTGLVGSSEGDIWLIKTNENGDTLWTKTLGGVDGDFGYSVQQTTDGGYIITGLTDFIIGWSGNAWLIKTDENGDTLWTKTFGGTSFEEGNSVQQTSDGGYIITGPTNSFGAGNLDVWLIKLEPDSPSVIISFEKKVPSSFSLSQNFPNPFNPSTKINYSVPQSSNVVIKVFDILGNEIETLVDEQKQTGTYEITWYAKNLPSSIYFYRLQAGDFFETKKMVLLR